MKTATRKLKIVLGTEIRLVQFTDNLTVLRAKIADIFGTKIPLGFKTFYLDDEKDVIMMTTQEDFRAALEQNKGNCLKIYIGENCEDIKESTIKLINAGIVKSENEFEMIGKKETNPKCEEIKEEPKIPIIPEPPKEEIIEKFAEQVKSMIKQELSKVPAQELETRMSSLMLTTSAMALGPTNPASQNINFDKNAKCYVCKAPISMIIYKCLTCENYYLCDKCEEKYSHEHLLVKQRNMLFKEPEKPKLPEYKCEYFDMNGQKPIKCKTDQHLTFHWIIKNTGETAWPANTIFTFVNGPLKMSEHKVGSIKAGEFIKFITHLTTPALDGKYYGFFALLCNKTTRIGKEIKLTLEVEQGKLPVKMPDSMKNAIILAKLNVEKEHEFNMLKLLELNPEFDAEIMYSILKKHNNNLQEAANEIFSKSQMPA